MAHDFVLDASQLKINMVKYRNNNRGRNGDHKNNNARKRGGS